MKVRVRGMGVGGAVRGGGMGGVRGGSAREVDQLLDLVDAALQPLLDQHGRGHPLRLGGGARRWGGEAVGRPVREAASA